VGKTHLIGRARPKLMAVGSTMLTKPFAKPLIAKLRKPVRAEA